MNSDVLMYLISDIHIDSKNSESIVNRMRRFLEKVDSINKVKESREILFLIIGDIAFSGNGDEYNFLDPIIRELRDRGTVITCPGNHDHDFSCYQGNLRSTLLATNIDDVDSSIIEVVTKGQDAYRDFHNRACSIEPRQKGLLSEQYDFFDKVSVRSLNSAWCSQIREEGGSIKFPLEYLVPHNESLDIRITMFHHPLSWFEPDNSKVLRNAMRCDSNIVITGHEHLEDSFKLDSDHGTTLLIETLPFYDNEVNDNGFIVLRPDGENVDVEVYSWLSGDFEIIKKTTKNEIINSGGLLTAGYRLDDEFFDFLNDTGVAFSHPDRQSLKIEDVFVYPNLRNLSSSSGTMKRESSSNLLSNTSLEKVVLIGEEYVGKTTLLKKLYLDSAKSGLVPVFVKGSDIRKANKYKESKLERILKSQYPDLDLVKLSGAPEEKILFVDNFDRIVGNDESCRKVLASFEKYFDRIFITVSDAYDLSEAQVNSENPIGDEYSRIKILNFGYRLRYDLISRWNGLKEVCDESPKELVLQNDDAYSRINRIIGKNYIPSTPFFLLTMLQSIDNGLASDINTSSYGYYYQYLITSSLGASSVKKENLDEIFNYSRELAYFYFKKDSKEVGFDDLWGFNQSFCEEYGLKIDCRPRLELLERARILSSKDDSYSFKYPYVYYFFIAKHLADNISDDESISIVESLVGTLHKRKSMDILMFLTHHSKESSILDKIIDRSSNLFSEYQPADLDVGAYFLEAIVDRLPEVAFKKVDPHEYRRELGDIQDDRSEGKSPEDDDHIDSEHSDPQGINKFIYDFNVTFKSLELLGQLSRNYYGSLKVNQKEKLLNEAIKAPLRAIESILQIFRDNPQRAIDMVESRLSEELSSSEVSDEELKDFARQVLFEIIRGITFHIIKKISASIGSKSLTPVIESISNKENTNALKLIELSVKLDLGSHGAIDDLKRMSYDFKDNALALTVLKSMVAHYLYMFELKEGEVKRVCHAVGINYKSVSHHIGVNRISSAR